MEVRNPWIYKGLIPFPGRHAMSHGELSLYDILMRVERGVLRVDDAATPPVRAPRAKIVRHLP